MSIHILADCIRIEMPILYVPSLNCGFHPRIIFIQAISPFIHIVFSLAIVFLYCRLLLGTQKEEKLLPNAG